MVLFRCFSSLIPSLSARLAQARYTTPPPPPPPPRAQQKGPGGPYCSGALGVRWTHTGAPAPVPTPSTGARWRLACAPIPARPGSPKLPPRLPEQGPCGSPEPLWLWSTRPRMPCLRKAPKPTGPRLPDSGFRAGAGEAAALPLSQGSALTCVAPPRLRPGQERAHGGQSRRAGSSGAGGNQHRLAWRRGSRRPQDLASVPGEPQPRALCLGLCRRVTVLGAVSSQGRGSGGTESGSASPWSPARARKLAGRTGSDCARPGDGGAGPGRGAADAPRGYPDGGCSLERAGGAARTELQAGHVRAVPDLGCSARGRASGGCALEGAATGAASRVRVSLLPMLKVTAAPSGQVGARGVFTSLPWISRGSSSWPLIPPPFSRPGQGGHFVH